MVDLVKGLDVSIIQGNINWQSIKDAGYEFCVMRCGVGNSGIDANYTKNIVGAKAVGLKVAAYHFIFPLPPLDGQPLRDPVKQAQYHFKAAAGEIACVDCEWPVPEDWNKWSCSAAQLNTWMLAYLAEYERLDGRKPLIYTYPYWASDVKFDPQFAKYQLWIASYQAGTPFIPKPWTDWSLWQDGGGTVATLPGTGIKVDTDKAKDLSVWDAPAAPVQELLPEHQPDPVPVPVAPPPAPVPAPVAKPASTNLITLLVNFLSNLFKKSS